MENSEKKLWAQRLALAMDIGEQLIVCGAEVSRVEDSIRRILISFGCKNPAVLTITTSIIVTIEIDDYEPITQTRRIGNSAYNMDRLEKMNSISRKICYEHISIDSARKLYDEAVAAEPYSFKAQILFFMGISFTFALFFGGSFRDALVSMAIAILLGFLQRIFFKVDINKFLSILVCSIVGGLLSMTAVSMGIGDSVSKISIGNIMLLIPGIALTNSIRDMFSGDTITGYTKFIESSLIAVMIAFGFVAASIFYNKIFISNSIGRAPYYSPIVVIIIQLISSFFGALSYSGSFNVRPNRLLLAGLGGLIGWAVYLAAGLFITIEPVKYLCSAIVVNMYADSMARVKKVPSTVFLVSAIMPLVPGGGLYETMAFVVIRDWNSCGSQGVRTISIALAIAFGILISQVIVHLVRLSVRQLKQY